MSGSLALPVPVPSLHGAAGAVPPRQQPSPVGRRHLSEPEGRVGRSGEPTLTGRGTWRERGQPAEDQRQDTASPWPCACPWPSSERGVATSVPRALRSVVAVGGMPAWLRLQACPPPPHRPLRAPLLKLQGHRPSPRLSPSRDCLEARGDTQAKPLSKLPLWIDDHQAPTPRPRNPMCGFAAGARPGSRQPWQHRRHTPGPPFSPPSPAHPAGARRAGRDSALRRAAFWGTSASHLSQGHRMERRHHRKSGGTGGVT